MNPKDTALPRSETGANGYRPIVRFCRWDGLIVLAVLILAGSVALALWSAAHTASSKDAHAEAVVTVNGEEVWRVNLSEITTAKDYAVTGSSETWTVRAEQGRVCILISSCPDQVCVHTGWLSSPGQSAVCLPYRVVLKVISMDNGGVESSKDTTSYDVISK
jgi:hypothetical protein